MTERVLALRSRAIQVATGSLNNINYIESNKLNSTTISEASCNHKERIRRLKRELLNQSFELDRLLNGTNANMAYEFPIENAMKFIPDYNGAPKELDGFLYQIDYFAKQIPDGHSEEELIRIVMLKLRGNAAGYFKRIVADTWDEIRNNLVKVFGERFHLEAIFHEVETLRQGFHEPYSSYKERVLMLKEHIMSSDTKNSEDSYAIKNLKIHFLAGLKNPELQTLARTNKHLDFDHLLEYLEEEVVQLEHIHMIEERLRKTEASSMNDGNTRYNTYSGNQGNSWERTASRIDGPHSSRTYALRGNNQFNMSNASINGCGSPQQNSTTNFNSSNNGQGNLTQSYNQNNFSRQPRQPNNFSKNE